MGVVVQNTPSGVIKIVQGGTTQVIAAGIAQTSAGAFSPPSGTGFIHTTGGVMDAAARNPLASEVPGFDNVTVTGVPSAGQVPVASTGTAAAWAFPTVSGNGVTGGTAGQVFITNSTPASAWTSLISLELTHGRFTSGNGGTDAATAIGPLVGNEATFGGVYLLGHGVAPSASNWAMAGNATNTYIGFPTGGILHISQPGVGDYVTLTPGAWAWYSGGVITAAVSLAHGYGGFGNGFVGGGTEAFAALGPLVGAETTHGALWFLQTGQALSQTNRVFNSNGATIVTLNVPTAGGDIFIYEAGLTQRADINVTHGLATFGGGGSDYKALIGPLVGLETSYGAVYVLATATAPSSSNWAFRGDGTSVVQFNAPSGGEVDFLVAGSIYGSFAGSASTGKLTLGNVAPSSTNYFASSDGSSVGNINIPAAGIINIQGSATSYFTITPAAAALFQFNASSATSGQISWTGAAAGAGGATSIIGQSAGGTNDGGSLVFQGGAHAGASTVDGSVKINTPLNPGVVSIAAAAPTNLSNTQSNANILILGGAIGGPFTVNVLRRIADTSLMVIRNNTGVTATIAYLTGGTITIAAGTSSVICSDGSNLVKVVIGT